MKMKERKVCKKEECKKIIPSWNKSGYCRHHYMLNWQRKNQKKLQSKNICIDCGKRKGVKITCPHCNGLIKYMIRCERCKERQEGYRLTYKEKKEKKK